MAGQNTNFAKYTRSRIKGLEKKIDRVSDRISRILVNAFSSGNTSNAFWNKVRSDLRAEYKKLEKIYSDWAKEEIPKTYRRSVAAQMSRINNLKSVTNEAQKNITSLLKTNSSRVIQQILAADAIASYNQALAAGLNNVFRLTRVAQQTLINESIINREIIDALEQGNLRRGISGLSREFRTKLQQIVPNQWYVQAGSKRYKPSFYAELLARTKFHEAQAQGTVITANNYNTDLVHVSTHNTTTEICQQYENKIFSLSGKDKRFPIIDQTSPFHPNCLHTMNVVFESQLVAANELNQFSNFSRGVPGSEPPRPTSWKPVSKRTAA